MKRFGRPLNQRSGDSYRRRLLKCYQKSPIHIIHNDLRGYTSQEKGKLALIPLLPILHCNSPTPSFQDNQLQNMSKDGQSLKYMIISFKTYFVN